jgi:hypothetical protein
LVRGSERRGVDLARPKTRRSPIEYDRGDPRLALSRESRVIPSPGKAAKDAKQTPVPKRGASVNEELAVSVKDQIVRILAYGATRLSAVEGFLHGEERRAVKDVIASYPELFEVFGRGFPETGPKSLWVRLKRRGV